MRFATLFLAGASVFAILAPATISHAAEDDATAADEVTLEDVVVTAQKREQSLQDVPASVAAISGERIAQTEVSRLGELATLVPNLSIQQDPIGDRINIRGIQSGNNAGLEQSVATFVDGVYRGRGVQTRFAFLDVARVEVLRGPQGTLFGKNTIGGALNVTTARPTSQWRSEAGATYTFDGIRQATLDGYVSGPLSERVRIRLAATYNDLNRGHLRNVFYGESTPTLEEFAVRGTVEADLNDATLLTVRYQHDDFDQFGQAFGNRVAGPLALFGVPANSRKISDIGSINPVLDVGSSGNFDGRADEASGTLLSEIAGGTLTIIGAYSGYSFDRRLDADFSRLDIVRFDDTEDFDQASLEIRYASDPGRPFSYLVGGYAHRNKLVATGDGSFNVRGGGSREVAIDTLLAAGCSLAIARGANPATDRSCILNAVITALDGTPLAYSDFGRYLVLDQKDTVAAVFAEATWRWTDQLSFTGGLRYSYERKTGSQSAIATTFGTQVRNPLTGDRAAYARFGLPDPLTALGEGVEHLFDLARTENSVTYSAALQYEPTGDALYYAKISSGFKAGGFNSFALGADPAEAEYRPEKATGAELGAKLNLFSRRATLNLAAFWTDFRDIQTAVFTGSTSFIVQNAASATSRGVEVDGRFAVAEGLTLNASAAYVDFSYDSFPNAACTVDQLFAFRAETGAPLATTQDCSQAQRNDLKGRTSENTPHASASLGLTYVRAIGNYELTAIGDLLFQSRQYRDSDLDPTLVQSAFAKANLALIFGPAAGTWDVSLIGKNIFDTDTFNYGTDTPLLEGARQFASDLPRTVAVRARARF